MHEIRISRKSEIFVLNYKITKFLEKWKVNHDFDHSYFFKKINTSNAARSKNILKENLMQVSKRCFNVTSSTYYFHMKTEILADFQICISVPLTTFSYIFVKSNIVNVWQGRKYVCGNNWLQKQVFTVLQNRRS